MVVVSGFLPVPLPMMIPFMGAQSLVIGKMFGEGFQYGKRKISAMPNDEFNKLTFQDMMSNARSEMRASIPTIKASLQDMQPLVETVVHEFFNYVKQIAAMLPEETRRLTGGGELLTGSTGPEGTKTLNLTQEERDYLIQQSRDKGDVLGDILEKLGLSRFGEQSAEGTNVGATVLLGAGEQTHAQRVAIQAKETARVKRLQDLLFAQARATERKTQRAVAPAPHIRDRSRSNVSMQSLRIEKSRLQANIRNVITTLTRTKRNRAMGAHQKTILLKQLNSDLIRHRRSLANFNKMHGKRF